MHSVDLSAVQFFRDAGIPFRLFTTQPKGNLNTTFDGERVTLLTDPRVYDDFTHVVYWGDFLNNPQYGHGGYSASHKKLGMAETHGPGHVFWRRLYTLRGYENPALKVFGVGGNFQHSFHQHKFVHDFRQIGSRFNRIYPRDGFSSKNLARFLPYDRLGLIRQGMDVAFLLRPMAEKPLPGDYFCWFFGRSGLENQYEIVTAIAEATGLRPFHLGEWLRLPRTRADEVFQAQRAQIAASRFVLTDTYHLLVNSITLGVPVIPVARDIPAQEGTLGDFKKHTLLDILGLSDQMVLVPPDEPGPSPQHVARVADAIVQTGAPARDRYALTRQLTAKFRADIIHDLFSERTVA